VIDKNELSNNVEISVPAREIKKHRMEGSRVEKAANMLWRLSFAPELLYQVCYHLPRSHIPEVVMADPYFCQHWTRLHVTTEERVLTPNRIGKNGKIRHPRKVVIGYTDGQLDKMTYYIADRLESVKQYSNGGQKLTITKYHLNLNYQNTVKEVSEYIKYGSVEEARKHTKQRFCRNGRQLLSADSNTLNHDSHNYKFHKCLLILTEAIPLPLSLYS